MANWRGSCISLVIIPLASVWGCSSSPHFPEMTGSPQLSAAAVEGCDTLVVTVPVTLDAASVEVTLSGSGLVPVHVDSESPTLVSIGFRVPAAGVPAGIGVFEVDLYTSQVTTNSGYQFRESNYINNMGTGTFHLDQAECNAVESPGSFHQDCNGVTDRTTDIVVPAVIPAAAAPAACSG